jgi:hypothetical protein
MGFKIKVSLNFTERWADNFFLLFTDSPYNLQYNEIYLSTETTDKSVAEVIQCEGKVLVEKIIQEVAHAVI